ncbi:MAG: AAA family ATPase [Anaerolineae bacterium]|nr:AAA family ATPase [Anaerolineae bacterium]
MGAPQSGTIGRACAHPLGPYPMLCESCGFENRADARFCGMCGSRLVKLCVTCGTANPLTYRYCINCGTQLPPAPLRAPTTVQSLAPVEASSPVAGHDRRRPLPVEAAERSISPTPQLEGERRVATIIMADVHGSTNLLERVGSEAWVEIMNQMFQVLEAEIYRFGGHVDQFRGDGLVAFFGTQIAHEDDPERGVLAAMAMQRAIRTYADNLAAQEGIELSLRVGVNTGEVIVASVGDHQTHSENTAMGEAIALAARMEQAAEPGTVLVSENTQRLVEDQFDWLPLGEISVKGVSQLVSVYRPLASHVQPDQPQEYELARLIGRDRAMATVIQCVEDLREGRGSIVLLTGEQGMGKSLLVREARRHFARQEALIAEISHTDGSGDGPEAAAETRPAAQPRLREIRGRARSYDRTQPYAMWQDLLRNWLGTRSDEPREQTRDRLRRETEALWGAGMAEYYPDFARFLGLPLEPAFSEQIEHLDAESLRQRLFLAIRSWLEALARQAPLIVSFSDMHWADATSLELLKYCLPICDYLSLLWLCVFRPDRRSRAWEFRHHVETEYPHRLVAVHLDPLTAEQSRTLIEQMIGEDVLPEATVATVIQKAEGNPFFIQELVRSLIANGSLVRESEPDGQEAGEERWRASKTVTPLALPDSLQGLLMARIDRLPPAEQQLLQRAAVIGYSFWFDLLGAIMPDQKNLKALLTSLQRVQLISEQGRGADLGVEYTFRSKLVRDAIYDSLLTSQRAAYHLQIAEYIEERFVTGEEAAGASNPEQHYGTLALHYQHANRPDKELEYTLRNADYVKDIYANAEAAQHYTHALGLLEELASRSQPLVPEEEIKAQRFHALMQRHHVYYLMAEFEKMRADAEALLPLARELTDDPTCLIDALLHQPGVGDQDRRTDIERGIPMAREALRLSREIGDVRRELDSLLARVNQSLALSDPIWQDLADEALELARVSENRTYEARILVGMGGIYAFGDSPERSMEYLEAAAALTMSEALEDKVVQMSLLNLLGLEFERSGDYYRLLSEYQQERLHASRELGHRPMESQALQACGRIIGIYLGDHIAGLDLLQDSYRIQLPCPRAAFPLFHMAQIHMAEADLESARETLARIHEIGEPVHDRALASLRLVEAMLQNAEGVRTATRGDTEATVRCLERTVSLTEQVIQLSEENPLVSLQYEMAARCKASAAYLGLSQFVSDPEQAHGFVEAALNSAQRAYEIYQMFGFVQIIECVSEEVLLRYSQALAANQLQDLENRFLRRAYDEMMRKHAMIPPDSHYRRTYLEHIPLHREIRAAYATRIGSILSDVNPLWQPIELAP